MRFLRRATFWLLLPFFAYFCVALVGAFVPGPVRDVVSEPVDHEIILVAGLIHYDILLPVDNATIDAFGFVEDAGVPLRNPQVRWLSVGWGSEAFYTTAGTYADLTSSAVWRAATGDMGVMRFEVTTALPLHPKLRRIAVSRAQLDALRATIRDDVIEERPLALDGFSDTDAFYPAAEHFHALRTCNVWVAQKLADAGLAMGRWTPTPYAATVSLWWNGHLGR